METQPEVVVAAEAVRTWVLAQRAGWKKPHPSTARAATPPPPAPAVAAPPAPVQSPAPAPVPPPAVARPLPPAPPLNIGDVVVPAAASTAPLPGASATAPVIERPSVAHVEADVTPPRSRAVVRAALALAAVLILAVGGFLLRGRSGPGDAQPKSGTAVLDSTPSGAEVVIDGKPAGTTPVALNLPAGKHDIEFKLKAASRRQTVEITRGQETAVTINWNTKPLGTLRVEARPLPARVMVDGKERGAAPLTLTDLPIGTHTVQIDTAEGSVRRKVEIAEGRTESLTEEIFPGWLHVSSPIEVTVVDGRQSVQLDASNRVLLKPGVHTIRIENRTLEISETRQVTIEPGGTAKVSLSPPESSLTVTGATGAEVYVDGTRAGEIPLTDYAVKLGAHDIMVVDKSGATRHASVTVTAKPAQLEMTFQRP